MRDNMTPRDGEASPERDRNRRSSESTPTLGDREVPLDIASSSDVINRWLDGDVAEPVGLKGDAARRVEFWRVLGEETERRRQTVTPPYVKAQIMAAIATTATAVPTPWYRRTIEVSPITAVGVGVGLLVLGAVVAAFMR